MWTDAIKCLVLFSFIMVYSEFRDKKKNTFLRKMYIVHNMKYLMTSTFNKGLIEDVRSLSVAAHFPNV